MSADVAAELPARVSLAAVLDRAGETLRALLGLDSGPPELAVIGGWRVEDHLRVPSGRLLSAEDLASTMIGEPIPPDDGTTAGSVVFEVDLVGGMAGRGFCERRRVHRRGDSDARRNRLGSRQVHRAGPPDRWRWRLRGAM